jgi:hypothetical protein
MRTVLHHDIYGQMISAPTNAINIHLSADKNVSILPSDFFLRRKNNDFF